VREIIHAADPEIVEEWSGSSRRRRGLPSGPTAASVSTGETYKNVVKMTFAKRARLKDPSGLFNSSLDGNVRRAIDIHEGDKVDEAALRISSALQWRSISTARASRSPGERDANDLNARYPRRFLPRRADHEFEPNMLPR
jgi:hypothetical protein